jgi:hypothetical protein
MSTLLVSVGHAPAAVSAVAGVSVDRAVLAFNGTPDNRR